MKKSIATTTMVSVLACAAALMLSACTILQSSESRSLTAGTENTSVYRGKIGARKVDVGAHYSMGCVLQERMKHRLAITEFEIVVQNDPGNAPAYNGLGISLDALGDYNKAVAAYEAALAVDQNLDYVHNNLGYSYLLQDRPELAIGYFKKAVALDGKNKRYQNNLGLAYAKDEQYDAALSAFKASGDDAEAHLNMGRFYFRNGLYEEANVHFAWASVLKPSDTEADKARKASASLSRIHSGSKHQDVKKEVPPVQQAHNQMAWYDNDGFYTIPAGAIENFEIVEINQTETAQNNRGVSNGDELPIYTVSLASIASPEEERQEAMKTLASARLKVLDEGQALERLSLEPTETGRTDIRVKIEVSNGNGVRHMARRVGNYLNDKGFNLMYLSNASHFNHAGTSIYYTKGYLEEAYRLSQELPGPQNLEEVPVIRKGNAEIKVLIGRDIREYLSVFEQG